MAKYIWNHLEEDVVSQEIIQEVKDYYKNDYYLHKQVQKIVYEQDNGFLKLKIEDILEKCPQLRNWFIVHGIELDYIGYLISGPFFTLEHCHIDSDITGIGINFPVSGCGMDTETIFYEPDDNVHHQILDKNIDKTRHICYSDNWKVITRYNLTKPTICINTIPHKFTNYGPGIRISMTVRCTPETVPFKIMKGWDTGKDEIHWGPNWRDQI
jgi:hypothetical protein